MQDVEDIGIKQFDQDIFANDLLQVTGHAEIGTIISPTIIRSLPITTFADFEEFFSYANFSNLLDKAIIDNNDETLAKMVRHRFKDHYDNITAIIAETDAAINLRGQRKLYEVRRAIREYQKNAHNSLQMFQDPVKLARILSARPNLKKSELWRMSNPSEYNYSWLVPVIKQKLVHLDAIIEIEEAGINDVIKASYNKTNLLESVVWDNYVIYDFLHKAFSRGYDEVMQKEKALYGESINYGSFAKDLAQAATYSTLFGGVISLVESNHVYRDIMTNVYLEQDCFHDALPEEMRDKRFGIRLFLKSGNVPRILPDCELYYCAGELILE